MIKFLIISFLFIFLIYKVTNFLFKGLFKILAGGPNQRFDERNHRHKKRPSGSNVEVEIDPEYQKKGGKKNGKKSDTEGEYIEFEEIK